MPSNQEEMTYNQLETMKHQEWEIAKYQEIEQMWEEKRDRNGRLHDQMGRFATMNEHGEIEWFNNPPYPTLPERMVQLKFLSEKMIKEDDYLYVKKYRLTWFSFSLIGFVVFYWIKTHL